MEPIEFECVVQNLRRASRLVSRRYETAFRAVNLTASQFTILQALSGQGSLPHSALSNVLGFEPSTLSRLLKPLERRGLVTVNQDPMDARGRHAALTPPGRAVFTEARTLWQVEHEATLARLSDEEWRTVKTALSKLSA